MNALLYIVASTTIELVVMALILSAKECRDE